MSIFDLSAELMVTLQLWIASVALAMARPVGGALILPAFVRLGMTPMLRNAFAFAISLPVVPLFFGHLSAPDFDMGLVSLLLLKEILLGFAIGFILGVPFWGAQAAGDFLDNQRAATAGTLFDPSATQEATVTGTFFIILLMALFYSGGGLMELTGFYYRSYEIWPPQDFLPTLESIDADSILGLLDHLFRLGLLLGGPVMLVMLAADLVLSAIGRFAPQLNVFDISLSAKSAVFLAGLALYWVMLIDEFEALAVWSTILPSLGGR